MFIYLSKKNIYIYKIFYYLIEYCFLIIRIFIVKKIPGFFE